MLETVSARMLLVASRFVFFFMDVTTSTQESPTFNGHIGVGYIEEQHSNCMPEKIWCGGGLSLLSSWSPSYTPGEERPKRK